MTSADVTLSLAGKTALITGGSRGIGADTVRLFHAADSRVAFNYRAAQAEAEGLVAECGGSGKCRRSNRSWLRRAREFSWSKRLCTTSAASTFS